MTTTSSKAKSTKAIKSTAKASNKPAAKPAVKATTKQAPTVKTLSDTKQALNKAFLSHMPAGARGVFQAKYKPLNLAAHNPQSVSDRDTAFIKALKSVYGNKPFTQQDSGADSGNLARAIVLKEVVTAPAINGQPAYKVA